MFHYKSHNIQAQLTYKKEKLSRVVQVKRGVYTSKLTN